jgi:hypothetical protein
MRKSVSNENRKKHLKANQNEFNLLFMFWRVLNEYFQFFFSLWRTKSRGERKLFRGGKTHWKVVYQRKRGIQRYPKACLQTCRQFLYFSKVITIFSNVKNTFSTFERFKVTKNIFGMF